MLVQAFGKQPFARVQRQLIHQRNLSPTRCFTFFGSTVRSCQRNITTEPNRSKKFESVLPAQESPTNDWDEVVDVVVVGSGAGGLTAAVTAKLTGSKDVLVLEKTKWFGGTSAYSGGAIWVPMNPISVANGVEDTQARAELYVRSYLKEAFDKATSVMLRAYLKSGPEMTRFLQDNSAASFVAAPTPDYYQQLDGATQSGRTLLNRPYNGRRLGRALLKQIRYPLQGYCAFGSLQIDLLALETWRRPFHSLSHFWTTTKGFLSFVIQRLLYSKGTTLCNGNALVGRLVEKCIELGVQLRSNTAALRPIMKDDAVSGLVVKDHAGREIKVRVRQGVILASGGFSRSSSLSRRYLSNPDWTVSPKGNVGDGMQFGLASGGSLPPPVGEDAALWSPISVLSSSKGPQRSYPHFATAITKPGCIIVDPDGNRFVNEASSYQDLGRATHKANVRVSYLIGDRRHLWNYGMGIALPGIYPVRHLIKRGYLVKAASIPALAQRLGMDPEILSRTIERFNAFAATGKDDDFGRGDGSYDRIYGDPDVKPNPSLGPIDTSPYYALTLYSGNGITMYGLRTNEDGQVLKEGAAGVVPGLYAVGADANHFLRGFYPSGGLTLGPSMVFGYRAALHMNASVSQTE